MTHTAVERAERAVYRITSRRQAPLTEGLRLEIARAVLASQKSVFGLSVEAEGIRLTGRRLEALRYLARGAGTLEIANRMGVSEDTAKSHVRLLMEKLGAHNRAHAVALGFAHGLLTAADTRPDTAERAV